MWACARETRGRPLLLGLPTRHERVEGGLGLAVRTVATEAATVRRAGQYDVHALPELVVGALGGEPGDQALDAPEQDAELDLGTRAGVGCRPLDRGCGEGEDQRRRERGTQLGVLAAGGLHHGGGDPLDERVDVGVRRQVGRQHPQGCTARRVVAVQAAEEREALLVEPRGGGHDRGTSTQQVGHDGTGDRARCCAGHDGDVVGPLLLTVGRRDGAAVEGDQVGALLAACAVQPPAGLCLCGLVEPDEAVLAGGVVADPDAGEVLADRGPAVVEAAPRGGRRRTATPCGPSPSPARTRRASRARRRGPRRSRSSTPASARPSLPSRCRAVEASTPSGPVIDSVSSSSAAESTVAPSPPPVAGMLT